MSDESVISFFVNSDNKLANLYGRLLRDRQLPRSAFTLRRPLSPKHPSDPSELTDDSDFGKVVTYFRGWFNADKWESCEAEIAKEAGTDPRNIIIYCHDPGMQQKTEPLEVLVWDERGEPYKLGEHERGNEITSLTHKHRNLWCCHVFSIEKKDERVMERIKQVARGIMLSV